MTRVIEVRLKDKTTDEYVDTPGEQRANRVYGIVVHQFQLNDDQSLSVHRGVYNARYVQHSGELRDVQQEGVSLVGHYLPGQYTSFRETERDPRDRQPDPD